MAVDIAKSLIDRLGDAEYRREMYHAGREAKKVRFKGHKTEDNYKNACAAVACGYHMALGTCPVRYYRAQELLDHLETHSGFMRIDHPRDVAPGDVGAAKDLNRNRLSDHVFHILELCKDFGAPYYYVWAVDNRRPDPYRRNLGDKVLGFTGLWYALRAPAPVQPIRKGGVAWQARCDCIEAVQALYRKKDDAAMPVEVERWLNLLANHPWLDPVREHGKTT